jgi:translation initiation factor IF-2
VAVKIVGSGVGAVNKNDAHLAHTSQAIIYGFNVEVPQDVKRLAVRDRLEIRQFAVIYELIDDVKAELTKLLAPEVVEKELGRLLVKGVFKTTKTEVICGGEVTKGKLSAPAMARILRDGQPLAEAEVVNLRRGPQDTKEALEGEMCGMSLKTSARLNVAEGDEVAVFSREVVARTM